ncbi:hypothetical protein Q5Y75_26145 [Ruegeria sp. 2205SS24-7]|uniref:hypothetical protein n=1 Tax=Ruegeria discodermiae TaxID=3064389 RepID=UPI0027410FEC|nr:hypothetical protein [Ruegeria sp. 2205SS24-7]MDP5220673.1 hypothetical protein [Ruegeria sp. 2205SS24-7]
MDGDPADFRKEKGQNDGAGRLVEWCGPRHDGLPWPARAVDMRPSWAFLPHQPVNRVMSVSAERNPKYLPSDIRSRAAQAQDLVLMRRLFENRFIRFRLRLVVVYLCSEHDLFSELQ